MCHRHGQTCLRRYDVLIDGESKKSGSIFDDFEPPFNPPAEIDDPEDTKPEDWVDSPKCALRKWLRRLDAPVTQQSQLRSERAGHNSAHQRFWFWVCAQDHCGMHLQTATEGLPRDRAVGNGVA